MRYRIYSLDGEKFFEAASPVLAMAQFSEGFNASGRFPADASCSFINDAAVDEEIPLWIHEAPKETK